MLTFDVDVGDTFGLSTGIDDLDRVASGVVRRGVLYLQTTFAVGADGHFVMTILLQGTSAFEPIRTHLDKVFRNDYVPEYFRERFSGDGASQRDVVAFAGVLILDAAEEFGSFQFLFDFHFP